MAETLTFNNAALFRSGMFGIHRTDCKTITIMTGVQFAQYTDAIRVVYLEKGKRKTRAFVMDYAPWARITGSAAAIQPDDPFVDNGTGGREGRYSSCDPRWQTDFEDKLGNSSVPVLWAVGNGKRV